MSDFNQTGLRRRQFLQLLGANLVVVSVAGIAGCSGKEEGTPAAAPTRGTAPDEAGLNEPAAPAVETAAQPAPAAPPAGAGADLPKLSPDDPQAKALGYVHDAQDVDASAYPRYEAGQACRNCALFQGGDSDQWAGCSIFPGRAVNANGWCSAYVAKG